MRSRARQVAGALAAEAGIAVPIALSVLLTTVLLATVATSIAIETNQTATRDTSSKAAIEAADAGLRAAIYRLNIYQPDSNYCPTEPTNAQAGGTGAPTSTLCPPDGPGVPQGLGNGATYSYWISRAMQTGDTCTGPSVSSSQGTVSQRCITALGTAGSGVGARVQERVAAYTSTPAFPTAIFGTKAVTISNNVTITSDTGTSPALLGTNGILTVGGVGGGTTLIDGYQLPPGATAQIGSNVTDVGPTTGISTQYANPTPLYPTETATNTSTPYLTASTAQAGTCSQTEAQLLGWSGTWVPTNCNYEIQRGIDNPLCQKNGAPVADCDVSTRLDGTDFSLTNRTLYLPNNSSLVLGGGYYNFCSLFLDNNAQITVAGGQATIMIDSPSDPTSNCPKTSTTLGGNTILPGTFTMNQNSSINATSALNAQILVYGDQSDVPPNNTVSLNNNGSSVFALIAPFSNVFVAPSNNTTFRGAIIGYTVTLGNASHFTYEADTQSFQSTSVPIYYPSYWVQCPTQSSSGSDPTAGC